MANRLVWILIILVVAVGLQVFLLPSSSSLGALEFPAPSPAFPKLQQVVKLGEGVLDRPEDVGVDWLGNLYTATRDGWINRMIRSNINNNGSSSSSNNWDKWWHVDSDGLLGLALPPPPTGKQTPYLIVCDADKGLLKVGEEGVTVIVSQLPNGSQIRFADDVVVATDGKLYFSIASTKFNFHQWQLDMLDPISSGKLVEYDPSTDTLSILLDHLGFANGVALSLDQDYLIVCETWKYRCLKYELKGDSEGHTEIFIDNLPGGPDNIKLAPDGSFWIALLQIKPSIWLRLVYWMRALNLNHLTKALPKVIEWVVGVHKRATVVNVGSDGKIIRGFDDPTGKVMAFVTSALEFEGHLYLGNLHANFIGKLPLEDPST